MLGVCMTESCADFLPILSIGHFPIVLEKLEKACWWQPICRASGLNPLPDIHVACLPSLLQDLGVTKVGHMKRILCGIKELSRSSPAAEA